MNFCFGLLTDFQAVGCDPTGFRQSVDGTLALCHDKWAAIFVADLENDPRFTVLMHGSEAFDTLMTERFTPIEKT